MTQLTDIGFDLAGALRHFPDAARLPFYAYAHQALVARFDLEEASNGTDAAQRRIIVGAKLEIIALAVDRALEAYAEPPTVGERRLQ
jgi:hypothetical protein